MTFARKSSSALVIFLFSLVLEFTGYDKNLEVQGIAAQNGIKYVMAGTCIVFMIFGFLMAKKYVISKARNAKIQTYLALKRENKLDSLNEAEKKELDDLLKLLS